MNQTKVPVPVDPGLAEKMAKYVEETTELIGSLRTERDALMTKVATLQKTASTPNERVTDVVDNIVAAGFLKKADRDAAINAIATDPVESLLGFIDKLAKQRLEKGGMAKLGRGVGDQPSTIGTPQQQQRESDRVFEDRFGTPRN